MHFGEFFLDCFSVLFDVVKTTYSHLNIFQFPSNILQTRTTLFTVLIVGGSHWAFPNFSVDGLRENVRRSGGSHHTDAVNNRQLSTLAKPICTFGSFLLEALCNLSPCMATKLGSKYLKICPIWMHS